MSLIILANKGEERQAVEDEQQEWLINVLLALEVPEEAFDLKDEEMKNYLNNIGLEVWTHSGGTVDVERDGKTVAQWMEPEYILIKKGKELYYEIHIQEWALPFQMQSRG